MRALFLLGAAFAAGFAAVTAANHAAGWTHTAPPTVMALPTSVPVGRYGIGCRTVNAPNEIGPASYSVYDVGKTGVPSLNKKQLHIVNAIRHYLHSRTLRFAFIYRRFIVFDATQGPCFEGAAGYWIMNDPSPNMYYQPGEAPGDIHAVPADDGKPTPGPWMSSGLQHLPRRTPRAATD